MRWYRAYPGLVTNAKLGEVALIAGCSRAVAIATWHAILESCASLGDGGKFDTSARRVAAILGEPVASIEAVFAAFGDLGLIADGVVCSWSRRQFEGDSSTARSQRHRAKARDVAETPCNADATLHERCATARERPQIQIQNPEANASGAATEKNGSAEPPAAHGDPIERLWSEGIELLLAMGAPDRHARANVGRWLKAAHDDAARVLGAIQRARDMGTHDPIPLVSRLLAPLAPATPERTAANVLHDLARQFPRADPDNRGTDVPALRRIGGR